jgi:electron transport complex protein RnfG
MAKNKETLSPEAAKKGVSPVRIIVCLTVICLAVAGLLGAVNYFTKSRIEENENAEKQAAIKAIFGDSVTTELISGENDDHELYLILRDGKVYGYCAEVAPTGFGGEIGMMVGVGADGKVCGANIVSMSETPGLGSRAKEETWFLEQFVGKSGTLAVGDGVDALSGATISSKAVTAGINDALSKDVDLAALAAERNTSLWDGSDAPETEAPVETEAPETQTETESGSDADLRLEDTVTFVDHIDGDYISPGPEYPAIYVDVYDETDAYITETEEPKKDWSGNYIFPEDDTEEEEDDD